MMNTFLNITVLVIVSLATTHGALGYNVLGDIPDKQTLREESDVLKSSLVDGTIVVLESEFISRSHTNTDNNSSSSPSSSDDTHDHETEKIDEKKEKELKKEATVISEFMLKHRDDELATIPKKDGTLHILWKFLFHILHSRSGQWSFINPSDLDLGDAKPGHHKVIQTKFENVENNIPLPEQLIYSISNLPDKLPTKNGKTPVLMFGMESFAIFHLINQAMLEIVNSKDPVEEKVLFSEQWVHFVKHHFFVLFPYNIITSKRCIKLLSGSTSEIETELLNICKKLAEKSDNNDLVETFIMVDPENNGDLLEKCIKEKHIVPSFMKLSHDKLSKLHLKHNLAVELSDFISGMGMIMTNAEQELFKNNDFLNSKFWGAKCTKDETIKAENEIIKLFSDTQKDLNNVINNTFSKLLDLVENNKKASKSGPVKDLLNTESNEFKAAEKKSQTDSELKNRIEEAKTQFLKFAANGSSGGKELVEEMENEESAEWKSSVSAHILDTIKKSCKDDSVFCFSALENCNTALNKLESDTFQYNNIEKLHRALSAALLKSGKLKEEDYLKDLSRDIKHDKKELSGGDKHSQPSLLEFRMAIIRKHEF